MSKKSRNLVNSGTLIRSVRRAWIEVIKVLAPASGHGGKQSTEPQIQVDPESGDSSPSEIEDQTHPYQRWKTKPRVTPQGQKWTTWRKWKDEHNLTPRRGRLVWKNGGNNNANKGLEK